MSARLLTRIIQTASLLGLVFLLWQGYGITDSKERAALVRRAFVHGWEGYQRFGYPHDTLRPLSNTVFDDRSGWGATAVDALTAAILLEVPEAVETALDHILGINWHHVSYEGVAIFGSTIRYLGAMLSAHDLLTITHKHLITQEIAPKLDALVLQAKALAEFLSPSFGTPKGINTNFMNLTSGEITRTGNNDITALSGLLLEWARLSDKTGDQTYRRMVLKSMDPILNPHPEVPSSYPGLFPKHLDLKTGLFNTTDIGGWSHAGGGLYEMLLKLSIYDPDRFGLFREKWVVAADSTIQHLASHPKGRIDLTFLADFNGADLLYRQDHSGMFAAASFILGGMVTGERRFLNFGLELVDTYVKIYAATETSIGPEGFSWIPATCDTGQETRDDVCKVPEEYANQVKSGFVERAGYWMTNSNYLLRPEVLESLYYAYRATKDEKYRDISWRIVNNVIKWCKAGSGFAELEDVNAKMRVEDSHGRRDWMSSYVLSEVFMYAYIIHLDDKPWQVLSDENMEWVFSTQAHPLRTMVASN
ncbi:seven-hairpin glycosidase [Lojkania enalia]|uniref:alpha-1,2-Mannosidase n=1 Tax=Lojkania enalia TaxID=147567 RepID=A0A9P4KAT7_9PLEO|nr:seven-hairpin glycosidase [Didymosphaeria enalia]